MNRRKKSPTVTLFNLEFFRHTSVWSNKHVWQLWETSNCFMTQFIVGSFVWVASNSSYKGRGGLVWSVEKGSGRKPSRFLSLASALENRLCHGFLRLTGSPISWFGQTTRLSKLPFTYRLTDIKRILIWNRDDSFAWHRSDYHEVSEARILQEVKTLFYNPNKVF